MDGKRLLGLFLSLLSGAVLAAGVVSFQLAESVTALQQCMLNNAMAFAISLPDFTVKATKRRSEPLSLLWLFYVTIYGLCSFFASFLSFLSFEYLSSAGDTLAIGGSYLVWTMILARIFLKEKHNLFEVILAIVTVAGVVAVSRPHFLFGGTKTSQNNVSRTLGVLCAVMASIATAGRIVMSRKLGSHVTVSSQMLSASVAAFMVLPIYSAAQGDVLYIPCLKDIGLATLAGVSRQLTTILCILALRLERSGPVAMAYSLQTFFGYLFDVLIFHLTPHVTSVVGAILVLLGTLGPVVSTAISVTKSDTVSNNGL